MNAPAMTSLSCVPSSAAQSGEPERCIVVGHATLLPSDVRAVAEGARVVLSDDAVATIVASRAVVDEIMAGRVPVYGLNTGLGPRRNERVSPERLVDYQRYIILSHAGAVGMPLEDEKVRSMMFARVCGMARGGSGASPAVVNGIVDLLNHHVCPIVPNTSSVGASDLAALAAVGEVLIGHGRARFRGQEYASTEALLRAGLKPLQLQPKDALSIISSNSVSIGAGARTGLRAIETLKLADMAGALSLEAVCGNVSPFDREVHEAKPIDGQIGAAAHIRALLEGSYLYDPDTTVSLQDPLSFRTIPQVHGAVREQVTAALRAATTELNSRADNPLICVERGIAISNGNFSPMVLALAFDALRIGLAHVGMLSERRIAKLVNAGDSSGALDDLVLYGAGAGPRPFPRTAAYSAAALSSELKQMAHPATLDLPSLGQDVEDHGSLAPVTILRTRENLDRLDTLLTIEILFAAALIAGLGGRRLGAGTAQVFDGVSTILAPGVITVAAATVRETTAILTDKILPTLSALDDWGKEF